MTKVRWYSNLQLFPVIKSCVIKSLAVENPQLDWSEVFLLEIIGLALILYKLHSHHNVKFRLLHRQILQVMSPG